MSNKYNQIDSFLKIFRDIALENPQISFLSNDAKDMIYGQLIRLNVSKEDRRYDVSNEHFYDWIKRYQNVENINCFIDPDWSYFCQFQNGYWSTNEHIKVYIPLDSKHIKEGANLIFDFLAKNNVTHISKIGKKIRFDDIVIRLTNEQDARNLIEFVKQNSYINEGLILPNPFAYNKDGLALACDGEISYNSTIARCISIYIHEKKQIQRLNEVSVNDFYNFLINYYNKVFITENNYEKIIKDFKLNEYNEYLDLEIKNYKQVLALIIKSASPDFGYEDYVKHFNDCLNNDDKRKTNEFGMGLAKEYSEKNNINLDNLVLELVWVMSNKYGNSTAINSIKDYLNTGIPNRITRDNNLRKRVIDCNLKDYINKYLNENHLTFEVYLNYLQTASMKNEQHLGKQK